MTTPTERTPLRVVPHFSRLQEWIALDEGFFQDEGLEPELLQEVMHAVSSHAGDPYGQRPQDVPFVRQMEVVNSACQWGTACNAGAGMGRLVPDLYTVGRYALFTRPGSQVQRLVDLRDIPVGIGEMAGSHFTTLQVLEQVLPTARIRTVHTGGPGQRLLALLRGEVEAATLLDPEIAIAEARGLRELARGEFLITFWVAPTVNQEVLKAYFRALKRADEALSRDPQRYLPLWERNVPPALAGEYDYSTFGLGEKFVFEPYSEEMFQQALRFAERWGLHTHVWETRYDRLIMPAGI
jgi:ABC-type nitrate/sulfonate/bicarbonate transport system substrate-binding protein